VRTGFLSECLRFAENWQGLSIFREQLAPKNKNRPLGGRFYVSKFNSYTPTDQEIKLKNQKKKKATVAGT